MILAADTELSTQESKTSSPKILWKQDLPVAGREGSVFGITGAGDAFYLEAIYQEMGKIFLQDESKLTIEELEVQLRRRLRRFYSSHVIPFSSYIDRPDFSLIIAAERGGHRRIWVSNKSALRQVESSVAIGIGEMQARLLLNSLDFPVDSKTAQLLAAYLIFQVKQTIPGCGMQTDVICLSHANADGLHRHQVRELEEVFRKYSLVEGIMLHRTLGSAYDFAEPRRISKSLAQMNREIGKIVSPQSAPQSRKGPKRDRQSQQAIAGVTRRVDDPSKERN